MAIAVECPSCGQSLSVRDELAGRQGKCPKCQATLRVPQRRAAPALATAAAGGVRGGATALVAPPDEEAALAASAEHLFAEVPISPEELREQLLAFRGTTSPPRVSLARKIGTLVVLAVIALLPLVYFAALAALAVSVVWLLWPASGLPLPLTARWLIAIGGVMLFACLLKPLVQRRTRAVEVYPLAPPDERLLAEFVSKVCDQIDAPPPTAIQTECSIRAAAEYRRGLAGLASRNVVLTLGLPLVACLSAEQLAGVIANEMARFRRRAACRPMNFIQAINGWMWRSIYEDGRFDQWLGRIAARPGFQWDKLLVPLRGARYASQAVLFVPMFLGNTVASSLVRRADLDADRTAARLIGREAFAALLVRQGVVEFAWEGLLTELDFLYREQRLPDNLPQQLALRMLEMTPELCAALRDTVGKQEEKPFDSRASDEERLAAIGEEPASGDFDCGLPALVLFSDVEATSRKLTWDYYLAAFGPRQLKAALVAAVR